MTPDTPAGDRYLEAMTAHELGVLAGEEQRAERLLRQTLNADARDLTQVSAAEFLASLRFPPHVHAYIERLVGTRDAMCEGNAVDYESEDPARVRTLAAVAGVIAAFRDRALRDLPDASQEPDAFTDQHGHIGGLMMDLNDPANMFVYGLRERAHGDERLDIPA